MALSGCCSLTNKCFVDKRFNLKLEALSKTITDTYLTPTKIMFKSGQEYSSFYFGCKLKENRMNFVKFICDGTHWADNDINNEQIVITYEINLQKDKIFEQTMLQLMIFHTRFLLSPQRLIIKYTSQAGFILTHLSGRSQALF